MYVHLILYHTRHYSNIVCIACPREVCPDNLQSLIHISSCATGDQGITCLQERAHILPPPYIHSLEWVWPQVGEGEVDEREEVVREPH